MDIYSPGSQIDACDGHDASPARLVAGWREASAVALDGSRATDTSINMHSSYFSLHSRSPTSRPSSSPADGGTSIDIRLGSRKPVPTRAAESDSDQRSICSANSACLKGEGLLSRLF